MENDNVEELDVEGLSITLPDDINEAGKQFSIEKPGADQDILEEIEIIEEPQIVDFKHLVELTNYSEKGSSQLAYLVKNWEYRQANTVRLLREELDNLSKQKQEVELKHLEILEEHRFEKKSSYVSDKRPISMLDEVCDILPDFPSKIKDVVVENKGLEIEAEYDSVIYWKQCTRHFEELLEASIQREQRLVEKLQESIKNLERQSPTVEELSQILKRADHFLHFILQTAPVVIGHQDKELRYRFIYNPYPTLHEEDIIGKADVEIFTGTGVEEFQEFKREVLERGLPAKRECTFETELFGSKTFLMYVEPVFSKAGNTIGLNYMGMEVTDQVSEVDVILTSMVCEMENDNVEEMDIEGLSLMWPEDINGARKQLHIEKPGADQDMLKEIIITEEPRAVDFKRLIELTNYSEKGSSQLAYLVKNWEYRHANAVRLLREELDNLSKQKQEVELKHLEIIEEHRFEDGSYGGDKRPISVLDVVYDILPDFPRKIKDVVVENKGLEIEAEYDTIIYWKQRARHFEGLLEASIQREQILMEKLQESIVNLERQSSPVEELSQILKRADHYLHFILQTAPVVMGHQDKDLRYRFIYNPYPSLHEEEIIGKTDVEIFTGAGVKEIQDFKREVLEKGLPAKREFTFETELFGSKTFLIYVEPVFSKAGDKIGVNYMGMEVTDQVRKREKMVKLREEIAVQKARETELNKTIHITEETMRAKQMLATMSHEIRSPLAGVVSMAEILSTTKLEKEQRQLLKVMLSSGDLVLQLINDILDLSKVESGVMKLEATKFRPREVVRHVLQTAAASLQRILILEGHVADDVPVEVIGDVLRIRQILTNLISNAIKFTHEGKVGIKLYVVPAVSCGLGEGSKELQEPDKSSSLSQSESDLKVYHGPIHPEGPCKNSLGDEAKTPVENGTSMDGGEENHPHASETTVWIRCDVYDTGIGIPENALPTLFKKYMQVSADTARKYGGTGLGLAICKQLVELMGGQLTVSSREHHGSTFTFVLPYKVSPESDNSDDPDEFSDMDGHVVDPHDEDISSGVFIFGPHTLGSLFSSSSSSRAQNFLPNCVALNGSHKLNGFSEDPNPFPGSSMSSREVTSLEDACSAVDGAETPCQQETSIRQSSDSNYKVTNCSEIQSQHKENGQFQDPFMVSTCSSRVESEEASEKVRPKDSQEEIEMQERSERSSQCSSSKGQEIIRSKLKPKILLVEDNKINVMVAQSMMTRFGHNIDVVNNGVEAVRAVQSRSYDLILMDVCMPVMDGLQATRLIRSFEETGNWDAAVEAGIEHQVPQNSASNHPQFNSSRNRIPIIAMTANALSESADECFANGMDSFVSKPVTFQKLRECLEQYVT